MFKSHSYKQFAESGEGKSPFDAVFAAVLVAAWTGLIVILLQGPGTAIAQEATAGEPTPEQSAPGAVEDLAASQPVNLEQAFWLCDYAATRMAIDTYAAAGCSEITEDLKKSMFNGDFDAMLTWWQENKAAEHAAIDTADPLSTP